MIVVVVIAVALLAAIVVTALFAFASLCLSREHASRPPVGAHLRSEIRLKNTES